MIVIARRVAALIVLASILLAGMAMAAAKPPAKDSVVTGQHRGYTNDELYLRLDDGKEMTFLVRIPGDDGSKWHKDFETLSRITVTYHREAGEKRPVATKIEAAKP